VLRVGGDRILDVNTRIVAATNKDLLGMVERGEFRDDLYYRLNLLNLTIAPLRERPDDIETLACFFLASKGAMYGVESKRLSARTLEMMREYDWPGNVRELENFMEKLLILQPLESNLDYSAMKLLAERTRRSRGCAGPAALDDAPGMLTIRVGSLKDMENEIFAKMLDRMGGNQTRVARRLGVSRVTVWKRLQETPVRQ
jgi:transcriptional regulator with PAS, ATPase and Fis domain